MKAEEWVSRGSGGAGLLDPGELIEADAWLSSSEAADLGIDADVRDLAVASHRAIESEKERERFRTRATIGGLTAALVVTSAVAVWGELNRRAAKASAAKAIIATSKAEKSADEARANAAEFMIGAGSAALANGHSFDAMHRFAEAIKTLPDSSPLRGVMSPSLGFLTLRSSST